MIAFSDINELNRIIRTQLIKQSGLDGSFVRNALSLYGTNLHKETSTNIFQTLEQDDVLMLFELQIPQNQYDTSMTEDDDSISYFKSFVMKIIIYGANADNVAIKTAARLRSEFVLNKLSEEGIYIQTVTDPMSMNEYLNDVMWHRADFDINFSCMFEIEQVDNFDNLEQIDITSINE